MPPLENATPLLFYVSKFPDLSRRGWLLLTAFPASSTDPVGKAEQGSTARRQAETTLRKKYLTGSDTRDSY